MPTSLGFPDPADSTALAQVFNRIRALALSLDDFLKTSTGVVSRPTGIVEANIADGGGVRLTKTGNRVQLMAEFAASGVSFSAGQTLLTIPAGWRPVGGRASGIGFLGSGPGLVLVNHNTGALTAPFSTLPNGNGAFVNLTWRL